MKKILFFVVAAFTFSLVYCGEGVEKDIKESNKSIKGIIVDAKTGEELVGVAVKINDQVVYTDFNGEFIANNVEANTNVITANYVSYKTVNVDLKNLKDNSNIISMSAE